MGVAARPASKGLGPQNPVHFGNLLSQNRVTKHSDPGPALIRKLYVQNTIT